MRELILVGGGRLAGAIRERFPLYSTIPVRGYQPGAGSSAGSVFVHAGSGRQYGEALKRASEINCPFIQAATERNIPMPLPREGGAVYVSAPNLDLNMLRLLALLRRGGDIFSGEAIALSESHQSGKTSLPGTALKICRLLDIPAQSIESERQGDTPHAYHRLSLGAGNSVLSLEMRIEGLDSYVSGLARIIGATETLGPGIYEAEELPGIFRSPAKCFRYSPGV